MPLSTVERKALLDNFATRALFFSLHTADPGNTGANEVSGGSPPYARKGLTWAAAVAATPATVSSNVATVSDIPALTTITHGGYWTAATGGVFVGGYALDQQQTYPTQGTYTVAAGNHTETLSG